MAKSFIWYELMTADPDAAKAFYADVVGWQPEPWNKPDMPPYVIMKAGERGIGGIMEIPEDARQAGMPPKWVGYIGTEDVDAATDAVKGDGGQVYRAPDDIPEVGRFSVVTDPQGAIFMMLQPKGQPQPPAEANAAGHVGWHELYTTDWQKAFDFYAKHFGWSKGDPFDMGAMGIYQLFGTGGEPIGGMMNKPEQVPVPTWRFYFNVTGIDAAAERVRERGGQVIMGPMEVPGGSWIVQCADPQGAHFALTAPGK